MKSIISRLDEPKAYLIINKKLASPRSLNFSKGIMQKTGYLPVLLVAVAFLLVPPIDVSAAEDIQTQLKELEELQNQLKELLAEEETDDTSLIPASNVMKLKIKEDKGIRGIAFLKVDFGIKEKARDRGVASVMYTPNFDPIANTKDSPQQTVRIIDPDNYLNHENLEFTWEPTTCFGNQGYCLEFSLAHEFLQAPEYDIIGLTVVDWKRNVSYSYFNDGIDVQGESLVPPKTQTIVEQGKPPKHVEITLTDKKQDLWTDENQNIWTRNSFDSWVKLTPEELQVIQDKYQKVMTRGNSIFESMTENEKILAMMVFNSQEIQSELPDSIERVFYVKLLRSENSLLQQEIQNESDKAADYLSKLYPGLRQNFD